MWLNDIAPALRDRLKKIGLLEGFAKSLKELCDAFEKTKPKSHIMYRRTVANLQTCFGPGFEITDFRKADALHFRRWMLEQGKRQATAKKPAEGLAGATVSRRVKCARSIFRLAVHSGWIKKNPFDDVVAGSQSNPQRSFFVDRELSFKILEELPTLEFRLVFALGRFGGLRLPSEVQAFPISGLNWDRMSMTFPVPKLLHIEGKEIRTCPMFAELQPLLLEAVEAAAPGQMMLCPTMAAWGDTANIRFSKVLRATLARLNVQPWEKLLVNLRASRATEVSNQFGPKAESEWIGHGEDVALRHYVMVTDEQWATAVGQALRAKKDLAKSHKNSV